MAETGGAPFALDVAVHFMSLHDEPPFVSADSGSTSSTSFSDTSSSSSSVSTLAERPAKMKRTVSFSLDLPTLGRSPSAESRGSRRVRPPRTPSPPDLPPAEVVTTCISAFSLRTEHCLPSLHPSRLLARDAPPLLLASVLLAAPRLPGPPIPGVPNFRTWDPPLLDLARGELESALAAPEASQETVAALLALATWACRCGLRSLAEGLVHAAGEAAGRAGIVQGEGSFAAPAGGERGRSGSREGWIERWTGERLAFSLLRISLELSSDPWSEGGGVPDLAGRLVLPPASILTSATDPIFDFTAFPPGEPLSDAVDWMRLDRADPLRARMLASLGSRLLRSPALFDAAHGVLAARVAGLLRVCRKAGLRSPRKVGAGHGELGRAKAALDGDLADLHSVLSEPARTVAEGLAPVGDLISALQLHGLPTGYAANVARRMCSLLAMRLELHSAISMLPPPPAGWKGQGPWIPSSADLDLTLKGLPHGLEDAAYAHAAVLASLLELDCAAEALDGAGPLAFSLLRLHAPTARRLALRSAQPPLVDSNLVRRSASSCLAALELLSRTGGAWDAALYRLGSAVFSGTEADPTDFGEGVGRGDAVRGQGAEEGAVLLMRALCMHRLGGWRVGL